jgi:prophage regulatory protein
MPNILRVSEVARRVGLSRTTIWRRERSGDFPLRIRLGGRSVGWLDSEVEEWLESRPRGMTDQQHRNPDRT